MQIKDLMELKKEVDNSGVIISFTGILSQGLLEELGEAIKKKMEEDNFTLNEIYNVFSVFIELSQNIVNYFKKKSYQENDVCNNMHDFAIVSVGKYENRYFVCSANIIDEDQASIISKKIDFANNLTKEELKKEYLQRIKKKVKNDDMEDTELGFLEMAKRASEPIKYFFEYKCEGKKYFIIYVMV